MWSRIWEWVRSHWLWVAGGAAGLLTICGLLRGRRAAVTPPGGSAPVAGLSPEQAQALKDAAGSEHTAAVGSADADLEARRAAIAAARAEKRGKP